MIQFFFNEIIFMNTIKHLKKYCDGMSVAPPPIVVNNIIYLFHGKLGCFENQYLFKKTPLSFMIVDCLKKVN
jgi:hypothetical protein